MAKNRNKVKFGLNNVHWAKNIQWGADPDGSPTVPVYGESVRLPGAVSLSIDANGENAFQFTCINLSSNFVCFDEKNT